MDFIVNRLPYRQTGYFTKTVLDYIDQSSTIKQFFANPPSLAGIKRAIETRKNSDTDRKILVAHLNEQYGCITDIGPVKKSIEKLLSPNTFTVTTAHQNNIFTGPLYFIYKILHTIRLAAYLEESLPGHNFVPVFYMGSEDADLDELNHIRLGGQKLTWQTKQKGAVGRMKIDRELLKLIGAIEGQVGVMPYGKEIIELLKNSYREGDDLQTSTFRFIHALFGDLGLVVLIADSAILKKQMIKIFEDDLLNQTASGIVENSVEKLQEAGYRVQANPREINLFYLESDIRERIEKQNGSWRVINTEKKFTREELLSELQQHPERFSPNVILRGLYQEAILPNIAFIGGGGETAYWLQLKDLFEYYHIPFPVLLLRNSFLIVEDKWKEKIQKLGFDIEDFFLPVQELINRLVKKESQNEISLNGSLTDIEQLYDSFKKQAAAVDFTLSKHVDALRVQTVHRLYELEKKMLRAEKRKFTDHGRQIEAIKNHLFPGDGLQERYENISYYYAKWGKDFLRELYEHSLALEQEFVVLSQK